MSLQFAHVKQDDGTAVISVFITDEPLRVATSDHPNFDAILEGALDGDESIGSLFDVSETVAKKFEGLSERVSVANGHVFFDGVEMNNALTEHILRTMDEDGNFQPLVRFYEKVMQNPSPHSRESLYRWLDSCDFTINVFGDIVGYKGVRRNADGRLTSINSGRAIRNGEVQDGQIENALGDVIEMPRDQVQFDPAVGCSTGLHVGTWDYANSFSRGNVLKVLVNPRDVVSVPVDSGAQKLRCCRYRVIGLDLNGPVASAIDSDEGYDGWGDGEFEDDPDTFVTEDGEFELIGERRLPRAGEWYVFYTDPATGRVRTLQAMSDHRPTESGREHRFEILERL